jgi:hypothetical protein
MGLCFRLFYSPEHLSLEVSKMIKICRTDLSSSFEKCHRGKERVMKARTACYLVGAAKRQKKQRSGAPASLP